MKVITFGEVMLRIAPPGHYRLLQTDSFQVTLAGAEANVAVDLAALGVNAEFVTKLPEHEMGQYAVNGLRKYGVSTENVVRGGERIGIFYVEKGASQRPSKVIYDRKNSSIAVALKEDFCWEKIFEGADWFHISGITPALGDGLAEISIAACKAAKEASVTVSCDLNFRKKLWSREKAEKTMSELCKYVDVCIANEEDAKDVFGISAKNTDIESGTISAAGYLSVARELCERFGFRSVAFTLRESISADVNNWSAVLYDGTEMFASKKYSMNIVDRIGGGDSFAAGLIYGLLNGFDSQKAVDFAAAASCLKHSIEGDFNLSSLSEIEELVSGNGSGRVKR